MNKANSLEILLECWNVSGVSKSI